MYIYRIYNDSHNYIGSTKNMCKRISVHKTPKNECSSKIIIESGNYSVEILEECQENKRNEREQYWIDRFECVNVNNPIAKKDWDKKPENKIAMKEWKRKDKQYKDSWGGDKRSNNNLLCISIDIFQ
jgi:predicted GIY-YIG superfamily endonuclease